MPALAATLGVEEVVGEGARVFVGEAERAQPAEGILRQERTVSGLTIVPRSCETMSSAIARNA